jgi:hypothetical protein
VRLPELVMESIKSTITHNTAQKRLQDKQLGKVYLTEVEAIFTSMNMDVDQIQVILQYARLKSHAEVKTIREMYKRYGIKVDANGNGGSEINLQTIIEMAIAKEEK